MEVTVVVGVRPHYVKAEGLRELFDQTEIKLNFLDVYQHYDEFLHDAIVKNNKINLITVSDTNKKNMLSIENFAQQISDVGTWLESRKGKQSKAVIVLGDATPALAGAVAANRMDFPIVHVEAGVRRIETEKEHWNSLITDQLSSIRYCYTYKNYLSLCLEGLSSGSYYVGDVLATWTIEKASRIKRKIINQEYILVSIHRPQNCSMESIKCLCSTIKKYKKKVVWIIHPRIAMYRQIIDNCLDCITLLSQSHDEALSLLKFADLIITDSGGFVREGVLLEKPVIVCHKQGMWDELVEKGSIIRSDINENALNNSIKKGLQGDFVSGKDSFIVENGVEIFKQTLITFLEKL